MNTQSGPGDGADPGLDAVMSERRQLINLAYRLLGSLAEAEDAVQETYARWYAMSGQDQAAFLVVLDSMTPAQRVALILHDVFGYSFAEVAGITGRSPAACRQLASSARQRVRAVRPPAAPASQQAALVAAFRRAWEARDIGALIALLDPGASVTADGGGLVSAALHPIEGGEQIARYLVDLAATAPAGLSFLERTVNGQPGLVAQQDGVTVTVFAFDIAGDQITRIWAVRNPDKLRPWTER
ncbi:MAG TPA: sigma factor-like helix-turn-helix DNA-binding protein [Streptosporangiaceae bacterium]|jgi:RNA polymerase sigma-70 factor (ECF subfamily)|nr:sigma factor-like helix-turn-helix DNA-binding protein [Streptosporangiaceae bacterium]